MFIIKFEKIKSKVKADIFSFYFRTKSRHNIPPKYFLQNDSYLFFQGSEVSKKIIGGYAIINKTPKRVLLQLPDIRLFPHSEKETSELTGLFRFQKKYSWIISFHMLYKVLTSKSKYFIYSYDMGNEHLKKHYGLANPVRIYSGLVNNLEGMTGQHYENVEYVTKSKFLMGIIKRLFLGEKKNAVEIEKKGRSIR